MQTVEYNLCWWLNRKHINTLNSINVTSIADNNDATRKLIILATTLNSFLSLDSNSFGFFLCVSSMHFFCWSLSLSRFSLLFFAILSPIHKHFHANAFASNVILFYIYCVCRFFTFVSVSLRRKYFSSLSHVCAFSVSSSGNVKLKRTKSNKRKTQSHKRVWATSQNVQQLHTQRWLFIRCHYNLAIGKIKNEETQQ